jgi:phospholipid/cholesterol/gamma-HCH transport system substrate-binding protein
MVYCKSGVPKYPVGRSTVKLSNEARVGLMVTVSFTVFIILVGVLAKINVAQSGYRLKVYFGFLNDLRKSSPVKIAGGIRIGEVEGIKQSGEKTEVTVWIENKYKLIKSAKFAIFTTGIIGEKYINVFVPPSLDVEDFFGDGDKVIGIDPPSFDQMMLTFQGFLQKDGSQILAEIFQNSNRFVGNLNKITEENKYDINKTVLITKNMMATMSVQMKMFMDQLNVFTRNMSELSEKNKQDIAITLRNLSETTSGLNKIVNRIESGRGSLGKLLTDETIYNNIRDASVFAKDLFRSLNQDPSKIWYGGQKR